MRFLHVWGSDYLAVVGEVGFEDVLDVGGVDGVDVVAGGGEHAKGFVASGDGGVVIDEAVDVEELVEDGARDWRVIRLPSCRILAGQEE